jgi:hypothetical protein
VLTYADLQVHAISVAARTQKTAIHQSSDSSELVRKLSLYNAASEPYQNRSKRRQWKLNARQYCNKALSV